MPVERLADDFDGALSPFWELDSIAPESRALVPRPAPPGGPALAITLRPGQTPGVGGDGVPTERAELREGAPYRVAFGTEVWYRFALRFPEDFPIVDRRLVVGQWLQVCPDPGRLGFRSPVLAQRFRAGCLHVTVESDAGRRVAWSHAGEIRGRWLDFVYRLRLAPDPGGLVEAWLDGAPIVSHHGPVGYSDLAPRSYFKVGLYRDRWPDPMTLYVARFRRGATAADLGLPGCPPVLE